MQSSPPRAKRRRREVKDDEDAPSAASDADADRVLSALPAHEVVRTSVLSRHWRDVWRSAPVVRAPPGGVLDLDAADLPRVPPRHRQRAAHQPRAPARRATQRPRAPPPPPLLPRTDAAGTT
ncbi:hypothetical protein OsI_01463 [Oryza sativa Indica Group]|uniref:F-box domain-containing protein n=1 Tax=Oryza sativa subsp. indica TaxID=39946 RepID=B8ACN8_ORYSI|nr:hypothetical protein OsI_01463 [Oryza sativa Indica Group]